MARRTDKYTINHQLHRNNFAYLGKESSWVTAIYIWTNHANLGLAQKVTIKPSIFLSYSCCEIWSLSRKPPCEDRRHILPNQEILAQDWLSKGSDINFQTEYMPITAQGILIGYRAQFIENRIAKINTESVALTCTKNHLRFTKRNNKKHDYFTSTQSKSKIEISKNTLTKLPPTTSRRTHHGARFIVVIQAILRDGITVGRSYSFDASRPRVDRVKIVQGAFYEGAGGPYIIVLHGDPRPHLPLPPRGGTKNTCLFLPQALQSPYPFFLLFAFVIFLLQDRSKPANERGKQPQCHGETRESLNPFNG